jgi:hypothetical protein
VGACGNSSWAEIVISWKISASLTTYRNVETKALSIGLEAKKVKSLASCTKIIRLLGRIEFGIKGMK